MIKLVNKEEDEVISLLEEDPKMGMTVSEIERNSKLTKQTIKIILAILEGADKIIVRPVGASKIYFRRKDLQFALI